ncbi:MAG: adenylosuccinate synthase [Bacteroidetes bacterium]|nr:adenylosuccinate synthase [Bacteroidota bacterium]
MSVSVVVGAQWGDEGKGKIVDLLSKNCKLVARYQGGANAGHTIAFGDKTYVLHLLPSGVFQKDTQCLIGNGVVIDPLALQEEMEMVAKLGIDLSNRLFISSGAHLIFPYHKVLDTIRETSKGDKKIGTTGRGIGPSYVDKYMRNGIRAGEIFDIDLLRKKISEEIKEKKKHVEFIFGGDPALLDTNYEPIFAAIEKMKPFIVNGAYFIHDAVKSGQSVLVEGAQGALLDIDHGTYPFVTSSNPTTGGACTGLGLAPNAINTVIGVVKAYTTRVGNGAFPTELNNELGEWIRQKGHEFGATTGRPRRCGWLDLVALNYSVMINGITEIALTKIDVLNELDEIGVVSAYTLNGKTITQFPTNHHDLENCKPVVTFFKGWKTDIRDVASWNEVPETCQTYIRFIEEQTGVKVKYFSTGPKRESTLIL